MNEKLYLGVDLGSTGVRVAWRVRGSDYFTASEISATMEKDSDRRVLKPLNEFDSDPCAAVLDPRFHIERLIRSDQQSDQQEIELSILLYRVMKKKILERMESYHYSSDTLEVQSAIALPLSDSDQAALILKNRLDNVWQRTKKRFREQEKFERLTLREPELVREDVCAALRYVKDCDFYQERPKRQFAIVDLGSGAFKFSVIRLMCNNQELQLDVPFKEKFLEFGLIEWGKMLADLWLQSPQNTFAPEFQTPERQHILVRLFDETRDWELKSCGWPNFNQRKISPKWPRNSPRWHREDLSCSIDARVLQDSWHSKKERLDSELVKLSSTLRDSLNIESLELPVFLIGAGRQFQVFRDVIANHFSRKFLTLGSNIDDREIAAGAMIAASINDREGHRVLPRLAIRSLRCPERLTQHTSTPTFGGPDANASREQGPSKRPPNDAFSPTRQASEAAATPHNVKARPIPPLRQMGTPDSSSQQKKSASKDELMAKMGVPKLNKAPPPSEPEVTNPSAKPTEIQPPSENIVKQLLNTVRFEGLPNGEQLNPEELQDWKRGCEELELDSACARESLERILLHAREKIREQRLGGLIQFYSTLCKLPPNDSDIFRQVVLADLLKYLDSQGVVPLPVDELDEIDFSMHKVIALEPTDDEDRNDKVARVRGWAWKYVDSDQPFIDARVVAYKLRTSEDPPATDSDFPQ